MTFHHRRKHVDQRWARRAACAGAELSWFFPVTDEEAAVGLAICESCVVRTECLEHALRAPEHEGIWGGLLPDARERIRRRRARSR